MGRTSSFADAVGGAGARAAPKAKRALYRWLPPDRIATAVRTALAAMIALGLGSLLPGDLAEYAYAAPLGAFITVGTTFFTIARAAFQQALGLVLGAALGLSMLWIEIPALAKIGIIGAVGVVLQGAATLGIGASVVPVVAVLVILFGGADPDGYALGYVGQFTLGLVVGVLVNALARPPLRDRTAHDRINTSVLDLADRFDELAETLRGDWPPEREDWAAWGPELESWVEQLDHEVQEARDSRKLNPRARFRPHDVERDADAVAALRAVVHRAIDVLDALAGAAWATPVEVSIDADERRLAADAVEGLAEHLRAWEELDGVEQASDASGRAIDALYEQVVTRARPESGVAAVVFALRAIRSRIDHAAAPSAPERER
ncbi:aromatic acid exporter family protein [Agrococcus sp. HG114]|uniref:FUSC family protein n=1 Tax=Agrococcus sp. HG114 TaxID=2969757 RepID=UPI00215A48D3|nr:hypothetical protein [Agrococcus sp. HG114]MCR8669616.1 hypothetical protein [Agrococcus sp. HG114]